MNRTEQESHFDGMVAAMREIMLKKGNDYSNDDRLSNFKYSGGIVGISPEQHCLAMIATKVARLGNLFASGKTPNNESVDDSIIDMAIYSLLLSMLRADRLASGKITSLIDIPALQTELERAKQIIRERLFIEPVDIELPFGEMDDHELPTSYVPGYPCRNPTFMLVASRNKNKVFDRCGFNFAGLVNGSRYGRRVQNIRNRL